MMLFLFGSAYLLERDSNGNWKETAKLTASDAQEAHLFGASVSLFGNRALIGQPGMMIMAVIPVQRIYLIWVLFRLIM